MSKVSKVSKVMQLAYGQMAPFALKALIQSFKVAAIITPPAGKNLYRSHRVLPVETLAHQHRIPIIKSDKFSDLEAALTKYQPQAILIASYHKVIPASILGLSKFINIHHGDLPRWRGRANVNWAIILGKKFIGLTFHEAIPDLDAGAIYAQFKIPITDRDTVKTVYDKINRYVQKYSTPVVKKVLQGYAGRPQRGQPTYCITRLPEDGLIDWSQSTLAIDRLVRALTHPYPGAFTYFNGKKLIVWKTVIPRQSRRYVGRIPGRIALIHKNLGVEVLTGDSSIIITSVTYGQKQGNATDFIKSVNASLGINWVELYERSLR